MKKEAMIVVDYQNDFANPKWSLYVKGWETLFPFINSLMREVKSRSWIIITSQDWHPEKHISFASTYWLDDFTIKDGELKWPKHCVANTWWADFWEGFDKNLVDRKVLKWFDENLDSYSSFGWIEEETGKNLEEILQSYQIEVLNIVWIATEYCDYYTVIDAIKKWYKVNVLTQWVAPVNPNDWLEALQLMRESWAIILP